LKFDLDKEWELLIEHEKIIEYKQERAKRLKKSNTKLKDFKKLPNINTNIYNINDLDEIENMRSKSFDLNKYSDKYISNNNNNKEEKEKENLIENDSSLKSEVLELLEILKEKSPQYKMNGDKSIWIVKPSGLSRGRGIKCIYELDEVINQVKSGSNQYVIQKYIENPLIINKRKVNKNQIKSNKNFKFLF
jgi:hypothetical protein